MIRLGRRTGTGLGQAQWPGFVLLVLTVIVPTACVLWFMNEAVENERLAVRQKLDEAYRSQLIAIRNHWRSLWQARLDALSAMDTGRAGSEIFADVVKRNLADSVVLYNNTTGQPVYPSPPSPAETVNEPLDWDRAQDLEHRRRDPATAAEIYARIANQSADVDLAARALQAEARCLAKAGQRTRAIEVLTHELAAEEYGQARDPQGRFIQPDGILRGLQLMAAHGDPGFDATADRLARRLQDYSHPSLPANQRRFLIKQLRALLPASPTFPTLAAEDTAAEYLALVPERSPTAYRSPFDIPQSWIAMAEEKQMSFLSPSPLRHVWQWTAPGGSMVALFYQERIVQEVEAVCRQQGLPAEMRATALPPGIDPDPSSRHLSLFAAMPLSGWRLILDPGDRTLLDASADQRITTYLWLGLLFIFAILCLTALMARFIGRQMRVARLKNDLVATVSHELKTPLSSIRLLVDTLLAGHYQDPERVPEYLQLIARENARLSRLIDNFLTFSRMERNKKSFDFAPTEPAVIVEEALAAVREKYESAGFVLQAEVGDPLPMIVADADALVTVLLNFLDNAYKYSEVDKRVTVRAFERGGEVCFEVEDHGIGISRRDARKIFHRFYQADRTLSRKAEGCGLGLSIVKFVVDAHAGSVEVDSRPGAGSIFTVRLPQAGSEAAEKLTAGAV